MKIFVDCQLFDKGFQGSRSYLEGLYLELIKDETIIFYMAAKDIDGLKKVFGTSKNVKYIQYKTTNAVYRLLIDIPYLCKKHKVDFAHFQYRVPPIKVCKYIVTIHDVLFEDFPEYFPKLNKIQSYITYKYSAKLADIIFTVSNYSKEKIEKHLDVQNVMVHPNGVNKMFFEDWNKEISNDYIKSKYLISDYIINISRWEPRKKHDLILETFIKEKLYTNNSLVFIGDNTFQNKKFYFLYNSLETSIKEKIHFFKNISLHDIFHFINAAKITVYPSIAEGFGIPPLESIALKTPTLCSNQTAMSDFTFLENFLFDPFNYEEFSSKLTKTINDGDYQINLKYEFVKKNYNWTIASNIFKKTITDFLQ